MVITFWRRVVVGLPSRSGRFLAILGLVVVAVSFLATVVRVGNPGALPGVSGGVAVSSPAASSVSASCRDSYGLCWLVAGDLVVSGDCEIKLPDCE